LIPCGSYLKEKVDAEINDTLFMYLPVAKREKQKTRRRY
jgi:hypothetical protein